MLKSLQSKTQHRERNEKKAASWDVRVNGRNINLVQLEMLRLSHNIRDSAQAFDGETRHFSEWII